MRYRGPFGHYGLFGIFDLNDLIAYPCDWSDTLPTHISSTEAKASFSSLVSKVQYGGERVIIERRGKPVAAVVSMEDLSRILNGNQASTEPKGLLAAAGAWSVLKDEEIDEMVAHIYATRAEDQGRPVDLDF